MTDDSDFSLADLAGLDVSEIEEVRFETLAQGLYEFEITNATLEETTNKDNEKRFLAAFEMEVKDVLTVLDRNVDKDSLVGKKYTEKRYIVPSKAEEGIGLIRSFVSDIGMDSSGKLGDIVENTKGHVFKGKITHKTDKDDKSVKYARLKLDSK